jgi:hypothetical protein
MITIEQQKEIVTRFLRKCNRSSLARLDAYRARQGLRPTIEGLVLAAKIGQWSAYYAFNEFTIDELKTAELDDWFEAIDGH